MADKTFTPIKDTDGDRMNFIQQQVEKAVLPYRENTEAAIVAGACMRVARILLSLYPPAIKAQLLEGAIAYLQQADSAGDADSALRRAGFIVPKGIM